VEQCKKILARLRAAKIGPHVADCQGAEWTLLISWRIIGPMKSENHKAVIGQRKQSGEDRLKRIESDIAILKKSRYS
jgi:hypothetical protein